TERVGTIAITRTEDLAVYRRRVHLDPYPKFGGVRANLRIRLILTLELIEEVDQTRRMKGWQNDALN
ncbi:MAG: hypothetical protein L0Z53_21300, partial [Acidobacteriales bacterium]|nr:hypothetical protein [Terriglobales bacterium]